MRTTGHGKLARKPPAHRRPELLLLCSLAAWLCGCALLPKLGPPPQVGPPYIPPPEPVWVVLDPALLQAERDSTIGTERTAKPRVRRRPTPSEAGVPGGVGPEIVPIPEEAPPGGIISAPTAPETTAAITPDLLVDLPAADRRQLDDAARRNLAAADSLARHAGRFPLPLREQEKLENALGLVRQAREALRRGDLRAAANLAYKARLLAGEVAR